MKKYLEKAFAEIAQLGLDNEQKIMRLAFSPEHEKVVAYVIKLMRDCNLQVYRDGVGNVIARKEGKADLPALMMGSHLDSVPDGGNSPRAGPQGRAPRHYLQAHRRQGRRFASHDSGPH